MICIQVTLQAKEPKNPTRFKQDLEVSVALPGIPAIIDYIIWHLQELDDYIGAKGMATITIHEPPKVKICNVSCEMSLAKTLQHYVLKYFG